MVRPAIDPPKCPRCGSVNVTLCGQSVEYGPAEWPDQPLQARELKTLAFQCECGLAFTRTTKADDGNLARDTR
jgi:hypothetical protein